jgi:hypothetical protein
MDGKWTIVFGGKDAETGEIFAESAANRPIKAGAILQKFAILQTTH